MRRKGPAKPTAASPLQCAIVKGHQDLLTDVSICANGHVFATSSVDRSVRLYPQHHLTEPDPKYLRVNLEDEYATACSVDPTGSVLCVATQFTHRIRVIDIKTKTPSVIRVIATPFQNDITSFVWCRPKTFLIFSKGKDTNLHFFSVETGALLKTLNTNLMENYSVSVVNTPTKTFLSVGAFTSDCKIWEITFDKGDRFVAISLVMDLRGHRGSVTGVAFSADGLQAITASKDGHLRVWDINVRYAMREDARVVHSQAVAEVPSAMHLSPCGKYLLAKMAASVAVLSVPSFGPVLSIGEEHGGAGVKGLAWLADGKHFCIWREDEKIVRLFKCPE